MQLLKQIPHFSNLHQLCTEYEAILWDMDGTIVDSEQIHTETTIATIKELGNGSELTHQEIEDICMGQTDLYIFQHLRDNKLLLNCELSEFIQIKNDKIKEYLHHAEVETILAPKILELIEKNFQNGKKQAVVTSSEKIIAHLILGHFKLHSYFEFVVSREDTLKNKPSPQPYLEAIDRLEIIPENIIIFEDSLAGLTAARGTRACVYQAAWYYQ